MGNAQPASTKEQRTAEQLAENFAYTSFLFWETLAEMEVEEIERVMVVRL